jgi:D-alanine-D-alanine ligase
LNRRPNILVLYNENPEWPVSDKAWTARMVNLLTTGLCSEGCEVESLKVFAHLGVLDDYDPRQWLVWNWVEELAGEAWTDALAAREIARRGFAHTGSAAETLAATVDRSNIKRRLIESGLPTLPAQRFAQPEDSAEWREFPAIVKGATQHGSFGIDSDSVVTTTAELARRVAYMQTAYACDSLVEPFLDTREFHVSVLGNGRKYALPPAEYDYSAFTDMHDRLFTYRWKFDDQSYGYHAVKLRSPAPDDDPALRRRLEEVAVGACQALGISDYGRVDIRLLGDEPQILDVNANPDLADNSAFLTSAQAAGLTYAQLAARIVDCAAERMP